MKAKAADAQGAAREPLLQQRLELTRNLRRDLVLDGDVRAPSPGVLRAEQAMQIFGELAANGVQLGRNHSESHAAAEIHYAVDPRRWRGASSQASEPRSNFGLCRGRQGMKDGQVRGDAVALGRIVAPPQPLEPGEILGAKLGREDQRPSA